MVVVHGGVVVEVPVGVGGGLFREVCMCVGECSVGDVNVGADCAYCVGDEFCVGLNGDGVVCVCTVMVSWGDDVVRVVGWGRVVVGHSWLWCVIIGVYDGGYALVVYPVQHALGLFVDVGVAVR